MLIIICLQKTKLYFLFFKACDCDQTGAYSLECKPLGGLCSCKPNVAERICNRSHVGYFGFGPDGCKGLCLMML